MASAAESTSNERPDDAEAALVRRARDRSEEAWAEIYDAHYTKLFRYCYARCGNEHTAAELASSVFLEALEGIDKFVYRGRPLLAWLYRIARNLVSDHLRKRQRESAALEEAVVLLEPNDPGPASEVGNREDVRTALDQLTEDQQQVLTLRFYADFTTAEIAGAMERSERAVYSLEVRALAALRRVLEPASSAEESRGVA